MPAPSIHVAVTTDEHYLQHAGVVLASLFVHNPGVTFHVHLVSNATESPDYRQTRQLVTDAGHHFRAVPIDTGRLQHLKLSAHATTAVYYRLLLPELLDDAITRVLYLDCDLVVKDALLPLWETPLGNHPVAAVAEPHFTRHAGLGLPAGAPYFNSGVMLINLPAWRRENVTQRAIAFLQQHPGRIEAWDQDALNVVLRDNWLPLAARWNQQTSHFDEAAPGGSAQWEECRQRPAIIHYSSKFKPWHAWCSHPLKGEYYRYLRLTPWKHFRLPEHSRWHRVKQSVKQLVNRVTRKNIFEVYA